MKRKKPAHKKAVKALVSLHDLYYIDPSEWLRQVVRGLKPRRK